MLLNNFRPHHEHLNNQSLEVFQDSFYLFYIFWCQRYGRFFTHLEKMKKKNHIF